MSLKNPNFNGQSELTKEPEKERREGCLKAKTVGLERALGHRGRVGDGLPYPTISYPDNCSRDHTLQKGDLNVLGAVILPGLPYQLTEAHPTLSTPLPGEPPLQHIS